MKSDFAIKMIGADGQLHPLYILNRITTTPAVDVRKLARITHNYCMFT